MKVGIITHYYKSKNVGGLLQAYALCYAIRQLGFEAEQICYDHSYLNSNQKRNKLLLRIDQIFSRSPQETIRKLKSRFKSNKQTDIADREKTNKWNDAFHRFEEKIPHSDSVYTDLNCSALNDVYDAFICGSDIIWHPGNVLHKPYYLTFTKSGKIKLSYAASMGRLPKTPLEKRLFKENIDSLSTIGVREKSIKEFLNNELNKDAQVVLDPTLLLRAEDWERVEKMDCVPRAPYILCYFLGESEQTRIAAARFAQQCGYSLQYLSMVHGRVLPQDAPLAACGTGLYDIGPEDIVSLIHHAEYILTDSFHAVVFSTVFQKKFYAFDRDMHLSGQSINGRIDNFIEQYGLTQYHVALKDGIIEFPVVNNVSDDVIARIEEDRQSSISFIMNGLRG